MGCTSATWNNQGNSIWRPRSRARNHGPWERMKEPLIACKRCISVGRCRSSLFPEITFTSAPVFMRYRSLVERSVTKQTTCCVIYGTWHLSAGPPCFSKIPKRVHISWHEYQKYGGIIIHCCCWQIWNDDITIDSRKSDVSSSDVYPAVVVTAPWRAVSEST